MALTRIACAVGVISIITANADITADDHFAKDEQSNSARTMRRLQANEWIQELAQIAAMEEDLNALSAANDALRDQILQEYYYNQYEDDDDYYDDEDDDDYDYGEGYDYDSIMDWFNNLSPGEKQYYYDEVEMEGKPLKPAKAAAKPPKAGSSKAKGKPLGKPPKSGAAKAGAKPGKKPQLSPELRAKIEEFKKKNPEGLKKFKAKMAKIHAEKAKAAKAKQGKATSAKKGKMMKKP